MNPNLLCGRRCLLIILDSVGVGESPDARDFNDSGCDTLGHICQHQRVKLPTLEGLGLGRIKPLRGVQARDTVIGWFGRMMQLSKGKDSTTGHWELAGLVLEKPFRTFPRGFPSELIAALERFIGQRVLGNKAASGTAIIEELGPEHEATGRPIVYTSADPVLQIAAHEDVIPLAQLYELCSFAFETAVPYGINRVIARPFEGQAPHYRRTERRQDFVVEPPGTTVLDALCGAGITVIGVGKVAELFGGRGFSDSDSTKTNVDGIDRTLARLSILKEGLILTNLVDFDTLYGHRRDSEGYARSLEEFDSRLPELMSSLGDGDLLIITADHGNDPTFRGSDHTREFVPLLTYSRQLAGGRDLGVRCTFADVAASIAEFFRIKWTGAGTSFLGREGG